MERRRYTKEFKLEAVQLSERDDVTVVEVAGNLGIRAELLYRWRAEYRWSNGQAFPGQGNQKAEDAEVAQLRRELEQVRLERDILEKAMGVFARSQR